jgi:glycosidase
MRYVKRRPQSFTLLLSASSGTVLASMLLAMPGCGSDATQKTTGNGWPTTPPPDPYDAGGGAGTDGPGSGGSGAMPTQDSGGSDRSVAPDVSPPNPPPPPTDAGPSDSLGPRAEASGDATGPGDGGSPTSFSWRDGIIYYIFADRFVDSNPLNNCVVPGVSPSEVGEPTSPAQYQGGDWAGITAKINEGYFKSLGVNAIMITSPMTNTMTAGQGIDGDTHFYSAYHGYWPTRVDPQTPSACYGTPADLAAMVSTAHAQGLKVLFDHTIVHVHSSSDIYLQHANWFWHTATGQPWCLCGTTGCDWDPFTGQGLRCWFTTYLPHWNYTVPEARDFGVKMTVDWLNYYGADGLRLDAIKHVDESWLLATRTAITNEISSRRPDNPLYLVGETYDGNIATIARYVDPATRLDGQFEFPMRAEIVRIVMRRGGQMQDLATWMDQHANDYGPNAVMSTMLGTHDMQRVIHHGENVPVGGNEWEDGRGPAPRTGGWTNHPAQPSTAEAYERLANAFAVIFTNKGAPLVYYGDEIGLAGSGDPDNRRVMPWTGLSAPQQALRDRVTALIKVRNQHPATRSGTRTTVVANANVWAYTLSYTSGLISDRIHVVINRGDAPATVMLPTGNLTELLAGGTGLGPSVTVPARQTRIYQP